MTETPDLYVVGNQPDFRTKLTVEEKAARGGGDVKHAKRCRVVLVPGFKQSGMLVLVNLRTLAVRTVSFAVHGMSNGGGQRWTRRRWNHRQLIRIVLYVVLHFPSDNRRTRSVHCFLIRHKLLTSAIVVFVIVVLLSCQISPVSFGLGKAGGCSYARAAARLDAGKYIKYGKGEAVLQYRP